jgi:hypothetical protein
MNKARPTQMKREREKAKRERQQKKMARRADAKTRRDSAPQTGLERLDAEIAQIVPGPQPPGDEE